MPCGSSLSSTAPAITLGATGSSSPPARRNRAIKRLGFGTGELRRAEENFVGRLPCGVERHVQQLKAFHQKARAGLAILALAQLARP